MFFVLSFLLYTRYLGTLKSYVRNRSKPEGSIAEGYLAQECLTFCSMYLADYVESKFNQTCRTETVSQIAASAPFGLDIFSSDGHPVGSGVAVTFDAETLKKAHQYVLFNCEAVRPYLK